MKSQATEPLYFSFILSFCPLSHCALFPFYFHLPLVHLFLPFSSYSSLDLSLKSVVQRKAVQQNIPNPPHGRVSADRKAHIYIPKSRL